MNEQVDYYKALLIIILILLLTLFIFLYYVIILKKSCDYYKSQVEMGNQYFQFQKEYFKVFDEKNRNLRRFRHDFNGHIVCLKQLSYMKNYEQLSKYINTLGELNDEISFGLSIGNVIVDAIINQFAKKAKEKNIDFLCIGKLNKNLQLNDIELCTLFFNALQNAYDECLLDSNIESYIRVEILHNDCKTYIKITNPIFSEAQVDTNGKLITRKSDKENHGLGVDIMSIVVAKHGGLIEWNIVDKRMELIITFEKRNTEDNTHADCHM